MTPLLAAAPLWVTGLLASLAGAVLGLLGGGGAALTVPLLVYGLGLPPREAMATSLAVVGVTSSVGVAVHARAGRVRFREGLPFALAGMVGAAGGAQAAQHVPGRVLLLLLACVMVAMAAAMLWTPAERGAQGGGGARWGAAWILSSGLGVGALTGLLGVGGGFVVVPALTLLGGWRMADAVATSLLVVSLNCASGLAGTLASGTRVDVGLAATLALASTAGALGAARCGRGLSEGALRRAFSGLLLLLGLGMAARELGNTVLQPAPVAQQATARPD